MFQGHTLREPGIRGHCYISLSIRSVLRSMVGMCSSQKIFSVKEGLHAYLYNYVSE